MITEVKVLFKADTKELYFWFTDNASPVSPNNRPGVPTRVPVEHGLEI